MREEKEKSSGFILASGKKSVIIWTPEDIK